MSESQKVIHARGLDTDKLPSDQWERIRVYAWLFDKPTEELLSLYNAKYRELYPSDALFSLNEMSRIKGATDNGDNH